MILRTVIDGGRPIISTNDFIEQHIRGWFTTKNDSLRARTGD